MRRERRRGEFGQSRDRRRRYERREGTSHRQLDERLCNRRRFGFVTRDQEHIRRRTVGNELIPVLRPEHRLGDELAKVGPARAHRRVEDSSDGRGVSGDGGSKCDSHRLQSDLVHEMPPRGWKPCLKVEHAHPGWMKVDPGHPGDGLIDLAEIASRFVAQVTPEEESEMWSLNPKSPREWQEEQEEGQFSNGEPDKQKPKQTKDVHR
jgi:hypothetical protein